MNGWEILRTYSSFKAVRPEYILLRQPTLSHIWDHSITDMQCLLDISASFLKVFKLEWEKWMGGQVCMPAHTCWGKVVFLSVYKIISFYCFQRWTLTHWKGNKWQDWIILCLEVLAKESVLLSIWAKRESHHVFQFCDPDNLQGICFHKPT
jgi:hypothetical protein